MASFKRSFLKSLGLDDDHIQAVMDAHLDVVNEITADRDKYKTEAGKIPDLQKQLEDAQKAGKDDSGKDYKQLYDDLVASNAAEKARAAKATGYKSLLKAAGVAEKFWPLILKANTADIDKIELDGEKVKGEEDLVKGLKESLKSYISETHEENPNVDTPPNGGGDGDKDLGKMSMADYIAARKKM